MNALKTGIDAQSQLIRGEEPAALEELVAEYHGRFRPTTPEQRMLVDTLVDCEWLLRRFRAVETQLWEDARRLGTDCFVGFGDGVQSPLNAARFEVPGTFGDVGRY